MGSKCHAIPDDYGGYSMMMRMMHETLLFVGGVVCLCVGGCFL